MKISQFLSSLFGTSSPHGLVPCPAGAVHATAVLGPRCKEAHRASPDFTRSCRLSQQAFGAAAAVLPREWVFELYMGKLCAFDV